MPLQSEDDSMIFLKISNEYSAEVSCHFKECHRWLVNDFSVYEALGCNCIKRLALSQVAVCFPTAGTILLFPEQTSTARDLVLTVKLDGSAWLDAGLEFFVSILSVCLSQ